MIPAYLHVATLGVRERFAHATRRRIGDPRQRANCCAKLPESYSLGVHIGSIADLAPQLEQVSSINNGFTRFFDCHICDQEWREDFESVGNNAEDPHVRKAT